MWINQKKLKLIFKGKLIFNVKAKVYLKQIPIKNK